MMDEGLRKKKKKRGRSMIFKTCFRPASSKDDPYSDPEGKILASDDNLVYCDVTGNVIEPEVKKSSSSRGRMSRIFKAVLFDAAMKKKMRSGKSSKTSNDSANLSSRPDEKINNSFNENDPNHMNNSYVDNSSSDRSNLFSLSSRAASSPISSLCSSSINSNSQSLAERKGSSQTNSNDKKPTKPPLPPSSQPSTLSVKPNPTKSKFVILNNPKIRLCLFILLTLLVLVVIWKICVAVAIESSDIDSEQYKNNVITGDEL